MLSVFKYRARRMNAGTTLFAQVVEFVPWKRFSRIVDRHHGDAGVSELSCADVFRAMAFARLTGLDSIRGVHVCLRAMSGKLFDMGIVNSDLKLIQFFHNQRNETDTPAPMVSYVLPVWRALRREGVARP